MWNTRHGEQVGMEKSWEDPEPGTEEKDPKAKDQAKFEKDKADDISA